MLDCTRAGRWAEALWYLDRLIAARPDDASLHEDRAAVYGKLGREADRQAELARVFELGADEGLVIPRAEELGRAGRWAEAAGLLARCGRTGPLSRELAQAWGIACLEGGRPRRLPRGLRGVHGLPGAGPDGRLERNQRGFAVGPRGRGLDDYRVPIAWFEKRLSATPAPTDPVPALVLERTGRASAPRRPDRRGDRSTERGDRRREGAMEIPTDWAYLALAHARKGELCRSPPVARTPPRFAS